MADRAPSALDGVLSSVLALGVRQGLKEFLLKEVAKSAAYKAVEIDCNAKQTQQHLSCG